MNPEILQIRPLNHSDQAAVFLLYKQISKQGNGIIRFPFEITEAYVSGFIKKSIR